MSASEDRSARRDVPCEQLKDGLFAYNSGLDGRFVNVCDDGAHFAYVRDDATEASSKERSHMSTSNRALSMGMIHHVDWMPQRPASAGGSSRNGAGGRVAATAAAAAAVVDSARGGGKISCVASSASSPTSVVTFETPRSEASGAASSGLGAVGAESSGRSGASLAAARHGDVPFFSVRESGGGAESNRGVKGSPAVQTEVLRAQPERKAALTDTEPEPEDCENTYVFRHSDCVVLSRPGHHPRVSGGGGGGGGKCEGATLAGSSHADVISPPDAALVARTAEAVAAAAECVVAAKEEELLRAIARAAALDARRGLSFGQRSEVDSTPVVDGVAMTHLRGMIDDTEPPIEQATHVTTTTVITRPGPGAVRRRSSETQTKKKRATSAKVTM